MLTNRLEKVWAPTRYVFSAKGAISLIAPGASARGLGPNRERALKFERALMSGAYVAGAKVWNRCGVAASLSDTRSAVVLLLIVDLTAHGFNRLNRFDEAKAFSIFFIQAPWTNHAALLFRQHRVLGCRINRPECDRRWSAFPKLDRAFPGYFSSATLVSGDDVRSCQRKNNHVRRIRWPPISQ